MPTLYFIRHGETDWNRAGRLQGQTETPLNANGRRQAEAVAHHLRALAGTALADLPFHASPMRRTRETVEIIRATLGLKVEDYRTDDRLKELHFGDWEGSVWSEIRDRDPARARQRDQDRWNFAAPGGESYEDKLRRVSGWLDGIREDACVIAHGGTARVLMVALGRRNRADAVTGDVWQGKVLRFAGGGAEWLPGPGHH